MKAAISMIVVVVGCVAHVGLLAAPARAQDLPRVRVEAVAGRFAFNYDEGAEAYGIFGGAARFRLMPRLSVGPEVNYAIGPNYSLGVLVPGAPSGGRDRALMITAHATFDFRSQESRGHPRISAYVVFGGGLLRQSGTSWFGSYTDTQPCYDGGIGLRAFVTDRFYVAPEWRLGMPHLQGRVVAVIGVQV